MDKQKAASRYPISRRGFVKGLAGATLLISGSGCASISSSPSTTPAKVARSPSPSPSPMPGATLYTYQGHAQAVLALDWSPNSARIASGSLDKTVQV
jgi:WD40 repeat protein